jgi:hypothetical protein
MKVSQPVVGVGMQKGSGGFFQLKKARGLILKIKEVDFFRTLTTRKRVIVSVNRRQKIEEKKTQQKLTNIGKWEEASNLKERNQLCNCGGQE